MDDTSDPIPLSALQHWAYCPRQWALIHLEQVFEDNLYTQRGQAVHARVDQPGVELRPGLRVERALPVWNERLGLIGKADVVEFLPDGTAYPVEYKHGSRNKKPAIAACDDLQLAAQALCPSSSPVRAVGARGFAPRQRGAWIETMLAAQSTSPAGRFAPRQRGRGLKRLWLVAGSSCNVSCSII